MLLSLLLTDPPPDGSEDTLYGALVAIVLVLGTIAREGLRARKALPAHVATPQAFDHAALVATIRLAASQYMQGAKWEDVLRLLRHADSVRKMLIGDDALTVDDTLSARISRIETAIESIHAYVEEQRRRDEIERAVSDRLAGRTTGPGGDH